jgi:hypothetical protein
MASTNLVKLRAQHSEALNTLQLARAKLERAQVELAHYEKLADAADEQLKNAIKAANRGKAPAP